MPLKTLEDDAPVLNLTSMVDVVFLLIVFFMAGTEFTHLEREIGLKVPEVSDRGTLTSAPERKVINVADDGTITLNRQPISLEQLEGTLAAARSEYQDLGVVVRGDASAPFQSVADVLNACKQAGITDLGISVRLASRPR
ncbi:MAG: biopolymer transporter ExbD [Pirellulales bacterium]|nr:biopolymer transporter ExbD [Pirellulales bacterium]